jgi:hypothetical protein
MNCTGSAKFIAATLLLLAFSFSFGQGHIDGDALTSLLGKGTENQELTNLKNEYKMEAANENHYLSKEGIELMLKDGQVNQINLYKTSSVYGNFTGKLPHALAFSMTSANVKQVLGKPLVAYNSGYAEFKLTDSVISCWFDGDRLSQVTLNLVGKD